MDYNQIETYWRKRKEKMCRYSIAQLSNPRLLNATIDFLVECGMPETCAPMLSFDNWGKKTIPSLKNIFHRDFEWLDDYIHIGDNNSGDPICIDLNSNAIIYLNHDNNFEVFFINSSVEKLAKSLIAYTDFIENINVFDDSSPSWVLIPTINKYHPISHSPRLGFQPAGPVFQSNKNRNRYTTG
jgi:hypothetical protein